MKTIKFLLTAFILLITTAIFAQDVAVFYSSDIAQTITGAAAVVCAYDETDVYDINDLDSAGISDLIETMTDASYHYIYIITDTAINDATDKVQGCQWDTLITKLYGEEVDGIEGDTLPTLIAATGVTDSKAENMWDELFSSLARPLVIQYMGFADFSSARGIAKYSSTDSTVIDSTQNWTNDQFNGQWIYVRSGAGIGQYRVVEDTYGSGEYVLTTVDFTVDITSTTNYVIKKAAEDEELFYDIYTELYVLTYLSDLSDNTTIKNWRKLMDYGNNLSSGGVYLTPLQDLDYLWDTVIANGKIIFDYLSL